VARELSDVDHEIKAALQQPDGDRLPELDGTLEIRDLVYAYDDNGNERGMHSGDFRWESAAGLVLGRMSGITNASTHPPPAFGECQRCRDAVLKGQFCGTVRRAREPRFIDCSVVGAYRLRIDPSPGGIPLQRVVATFRDCSSAPAGRSSSRPLGQGGSEVGNGHLSCVDPVVVSGCLRTSGCQGLGESHRPEGGLRDGRRPPQDVRRLRPARSVEQ